MDQNSIGDNSKDSGDLWDNPLWEEISWALITGKVPSTIPELLGFQRKMDAAQSLVSLQNHPTRFSPRELPIPRVTRRHGAPANIVHHSAPRGAAIHHVHPRDGAVYQVPSVYVASGVAPPSDNDTGTFRVPAPPPMRSARPRMLASVPQYRPVAYRPVTHRPVTYLPRNPQYQPLSIRTCFASDVHPQVSSGPPALTFAQIVSSAAYTMAYVPSAQTSVVCSSQDTRLMHAPVAHEVVVYPAVTQVVSYTTSSPLPSVSSFLPHVATPSPSVLHHQDWGDGYEETAPVTHTVDNSSVPATYPIFPVVSSSTQPQVEQYSSASQRSSLCTPSSDHWDSVSYPSVDFSPAVSVVVSPRRNVECRTEEPLGECVSACANACVCACTNGISVFVIIHTS